MITAVVIENNQVIHRTTWDEVNNDIAIEQCFKHLDCLNLNILPNQLIVMYQNNRPLKYSIYPGDSWIFVKKTLYDTFERSIVSPSVNA